VIPAVYVVYLYDVNEWEDEPLLVTGAALVFSGLLAFAFTAFWRNIVFTDIARAPLNLIASTPRVPEILVLGLLVPVVSEILKQIGPIYLASRKAFDDLMDGVTFGVISGVAFAAVETVVVNRDVLVNAPVRAGVSDAGLWFFLLVTVGIVKPLVYGTATAIACAEFSGLGDGYDGFTPRYLFALGEAIAANILYQTGVYVCSLKPGSTGALLGMLWGMFLVGILIIQLRTVLHVGLLESALESAARDSVAKHATNDIGFCTQCEMPLLHASMFCSACGNSVKAVPKPARAVNEADPASRPEPTRPFKVARTGSVAVAALLIIGVLGTATLFVTRATTPGGDFDFRAESVRPDLPTTTTGPRAVRRVSQIKPVPIRGGISVTPAGGWKVGSQSDGFVLLTGNGATFAVQVTPGDPKAAAEGVVGVYAQGVLGRRVTDLKVTQPDTEDRPKANIPSAASATYLGLLASLQQVIAVEGIVFSFVRADGTVVVVSTMNRRHEADPLRAEYATMLDSVLDSS
jgi:hypothetical protein